MEVRPRLTPAIANARRAVRECFDAPDLKSVKRVLLAVSGGADSLALALAANFELPKLGIELSAVIVNHNLQQDSSKIADQAKARLLEMGIKDVEVVSIQVPESGQGPEAAARDARYEALENQRSAVGADYILTAHTLDDQAETVLLGLTRGSGLKSIAGMQSVAGNLVRPLLGVSKAELIQSLNDAGIDYWDDPHNKDTRFTRVRIRNLMQQLEAELGPGVSAALSRTAELAQESEEFLALSASALIQSAQRETNSYSVEVLERAHFGLRRKALQMIGSGLVSGGVTRSQVLAIEELITNWHGQKPTHLSGITVERVRDQILFRQSS
jgi:tRNA(Ile)-lysidine synthase